MHVYVAVASPQLKIKHFLVPGGTTMPTVTLLTTEVREEKDLSLFPNLCFWRYRYLPQAGFQHLSKLSPTICAVVTGHICCVELNYVKVATQSKTALNLGLCCGVATARALKEATGDSLQVPGLNFPPSIRERWVWSSTHGGLAEISDDWCHYGQLKIYGKTRKIFFSLKESTNCLTVDFK